jgi:hypothetical protein
LDKGQPTEAFPLFHVPPRSNSGRLAERIAFLAIGFGYFVAVTAMTERDLQNKSEQALVAVALGTATLIACLSLLALS